MGNILKLGDWVFIEKAPKLPTSLKRNLVKFLPWLFLIDTFFSVTTTLAIFGLFETGALPLPLLELKNTIFYYPAAFFLIASFIFQIVSVPFLLKRSIEGWITMCCSSLLNLAYCLITLTGVGAIVTIIGLYAMFQIKESYK